MPQELYKELETKKARVIQLNELINQARANARAELKGLRWKYGDLIRQAKSEQICLQAEIEQLEGRG